jgi:hypothetical protein
MCKRLPWHVASGRAGWLITSLCAIGDALALTAFFHSGLHGAIIAAIVGSVLTTMGTALLIGWGRHRVSLVAVVSIVFGLLIGALPIALGVVADRIGIHEIGRSRLDRVIAGAVAFVVSTFASGFAFGAMLATIARLGLNHAQPFAALGIAGFKHFVRLRVREPADGGASSVDVFVIGVVDPVGGSAPVIVDRFRWPAAASEEGEGDDNKIRKIRKDDG